jgi:hypothetical protein
MMASPIFNENSIEEAGVIAAHVHLLQTKSDFTTWATKRQGEH